MIPGATKVLNKTHATAQTSKTTWTWRRIIGLLGFAARGQWIAPQNLDWPWFQLIVLPQQRTIFDAKRGQVKVMPSFIYADNIRDDLSVSLPDGVRE